MNRQNQINNVTIGNAVFKENTNQKLIQNDEVIKQLIKKCLTIQLSHYQLYHWKDIFKDMVKCQADTLWLSSHFNCNLIKQIQNVNFDNLTYLRIYQNNINNIESLTFVNFQNLRFLDLCRNNISQAKCLNKLKLKSLSSLYLYMNPLIQAYSLVKAKINELQFGDLIFNYFQDQTPVNQDLCILFKLNSLQIKQFQIKSKKRIEQFKIQNLLKLRFPSIKIFKQNQYGWIQ